MKTNKQKESKSMDETQAAVRVSTFAKRYDLCAATVYRRIAAGELRAIRIGRNVRVIDDVILPSGDRGDQKATTPNVT
jgi:hypothetical protein